ncbi:HD domain-containing protein [Nocardioides sp. InS609-2]|uniref:HD domain-containing protein n=1 Tax=Nocardioides sp. InS609-2 TaxID=2760705 RepID=UPI0020BE03F6|nr:HD domain-containing protein [Nocardioides sp. InS609-2]
MPQDMEWGLLFGRDLAESLVGGLGRRWDHVQAVGQAAESLVVMELAHEVVAVAAWLHDIGYAARLHQTGMHALDGARHLKECGAPRELVALVGHHTGASFEAKQLGLLDAWQELPRPDPHNLDVLTLCDMVVGSDGSHVDPGERIQEILSRYPRDHPVHQAVSTSGHDLLATAKRARRRLGLADTWPASVAQGVL